MPTTSNTANPTRTTVKIRTTSGAEHILATPPGGSRSTDSFEVRLHNHQNFYGNQFMTLDLIDGTTISLNPSAIESFRTVPVPLRNVENIGPREPIQRYVDEDPNL